MRSFSLTKLLYRVKTTAARACAKHPSLWWLSRRLYHASQSPLHHFLHTLRCWRQQRAHTVSAADAPAAPPIPIKRLGHTALTLVDEYWGKHTVNSHPFKSAVESLEYLHWRAKQYPLFQEFMQLYGQHDDEAILDYGCGPGNDLVGFLVYTQAKKVIGIDISVKALALAGQRLALHNIDPQRVELLHITDSIQTLPLEDESIDYIYCEGVLHHTSHPAAILREFHRLLKSGAYACIMVYNRHSLWLHLYTAYVKMALHNAFPGLDLDDAFAKNTDGVACPISRCYTPEEFMSLCHEAGFAAEFVGGYLSLTELIVWQAFGRQAQQDKRLAAEHREFLQGLVFDHQGYPLYRGKHAGIGGVYTLTKADGWAGA